MTLKFHSDFFKDISSLLNANDYNVIIKVGENEDAKEFYAHSNILRAHSQHFKYIISNDIIKKYNMFTINKPNITPTIFKIILKYFYTGEIYIKNKSDSYIFDLLIACDDLFLEELVKYIQYYLINNRESWVRQNSVLILNIIYNLPNFKELQDYCINFICGSRRTFNSSDFLLLDKYILFHLLKRIHLYGDELIIWNFLIKWGIKQTPELGNKNKFDFTDKDYGYLKNTLSIFIPRIRFTNLTSDDFYDYVRPYEAIIPIDIYDEIMAYYLVKQPLKINEDVDLYPLPFFLS